MIRWAAIRNPKLFEELVAHEPELTREFAAHTGFAMPARGAEFAERLGVEVLPRVGDRIRRFNETLWSGVVFRMYDSWKKHRQTLIAAGHHPDVAGAEAASYMGKIIPRMNPAETDRSVQRARLERTILTRWKDR